MKKRFLSFLIAVIMVIGLVPGFAVSASARVFDDTVKIGDVSLYEGEYLASGETVTTDIKPDGGYAYYNDGVLTLNNFSYNGPGYPHKYYDYYTSAIYFDGNLEILLVGENSLTATESTDGGIHAQGNIEISGDGSLEINSSEIAIFAIDSDITISDSTLEIYSSGFGILADYDINISGADITVVSDTDTAISVTSGSITISDSSVNIDSGNDGIYAPYNTISISGSTVEIISGFIGIMADSQMTVSDSTLDIISEDVGIFSISGPISINSCEVVIDAGDDGISTNGDIILSDNTLNITAGETGIDSYEEYVDIIDCEVSIDAGGDGIFAKKDITVKSILNITSDDDGIESYGGKAIINGGEVEITAYYSAINASDGITITDTHAAYDSYGDIIEVVDNTYDYLLIKDKTAVETTPAVAVGGVGLSEGQYLASGATEATDTAPDGGYAHYANGILTLSDFSYEGYGYLVDAEYNTTAAIYSENDIIIQVLGENSLINTAEYGYGIISLGGVGIAGDGSIEITSNDDGIFSYDNIVIMSENVKVSSGDDGIYSEGGDIVIQGNVNVTSGYDGICSYNGSVTIYQSTVEITAEDDGIQVYEGVAINIGDSTVDIQLAENGFAGIYGYLSDIYLENSAVNITAYYGIHSQGSDVIINSGEIKISGEYGIYAGGNIAIDGGEVELDSTGTSIYATENILIADTHAAYDADGEVIEASRLPYFDYVLIKEKTSGGDTPVVELKGASITVGKDLTMNYLVRVLDTENVDPTKLSARFTMNGKTIVVEQGELGADGNYHFAFTGIAPQCMGDNIYAEILLDGEVVAVVEEYSVKENAQGLLTQYSDDAELVQLVSDMLYYGEAAQKYRNYKTDSLVTDGVDGMVSGSLTIPENTDKTATASTSETVRFVSAGVWFDNVNKLYVNITTTDNVTLKVNGEVVELDSTTYYTDAIYAIDFDDIYTFELYEGETLVQTLTYSVKSYVYSMVNGTTQNESMIGLAMALYAYGESAKAYKN